MILLGLVLFLSAFVLTILALADFARGLRGFLLPRRSELVAAAISLMTASVTSAAFLFAQVYQGRMEIQSSSLAGQATHSATEFPRTLLEVNGSRALAVLVFPVLVAALPLLLRRSRARAICEAGVATLLAAFTVIGGFSVGLFYLPSASAMVAAALLGRKSRAAS